MTAIADFDEVELGLVVNLKTLREVLKTLSVNGRRWWIASDPYDAASRGYVSIGYGDSQCKSRLNTVHFRFPIVGDTAHKIATDRLVLLIDPSTCTAEYPGFYLEDGRVVQDSLEDFSCFYFPLKRALMTRLQIEPDRS
jgi:hypothetical protein